MNRPNRSGAEAPAKNRPLPRPRREEPTVEEAIAAAQCLSTDPKEQAEIAASLMGMTAEEVLPHIPRNPSRISLVVTGRRAVVVEKLGRARIQRPATL